MEKPSQYELETAVDKAFDALGQNESPSKEQVDRFNEAMDELRNHYPLPEGLHYQPKKLPTRCPNCSGKRDDPGSLTIGPGLKDYVVCNNSFHSQRA